MPVFSRGTALQAIYEPVEAELSRVRGEIHAMLASSNELVSEVVGYFFSSPGKFLRPALTLLGARFGSPPLEEAVRIAAAVEIFHSATLIHDDIIDGSLLRRNLPAVPIRWGPQVSVLVGDFMQHQALRAVYSLKDDRLISLFIRMASEVCEGELLEVKEQNNFDLGESGYFSIIEKKTAALTGACVEAGAILGGLAAEKCASLKNFGTFFGIAFQILDDCLDFSGTDEAFGKRPGKDAAGGVLTLPLIRLLSLVPPGKKSEVFQVFKSHASHRKM